MISIESQKNDVRKLNLRLRLGPKEIGKQGMEGNEKSKKSGECPHSPLFFDLISIGI